ncbi:putative aarF domain-containing protein kinase [Apostasia shenzhenica]|uniref:Putative aarF domain-containing protein kinase n=1 Tax=Apostasia shenzhenica TaxID=1088818 RepID=A0A2I0ABE3_9ASPA|nr:putative aarF domain-containing protein kinase [Apostasia shenzhenica]
MRWSDICLKKLTILLRLKMLKNLLLSTFTIQGVYCSLRQLLEEGFFHADPHPGNLVATDDGSLAYFDFGMMGDIPRHYRVGLIQVLVHFVNRDSLGLANDFLSLGFIPDGVDTQLVANALHTSFNSDKRHSNDFQGVMNQLYDVMYEFNFSLPPDYALVIRALGSLEGTAKALDPNFKVIESAYPFVVGRLLADPDPDMRKILRELLIRNDGSIRWTRLERLVAAISEPSTETASEFDSASRATYGHGWKSFDMHSVVAATEDLLCFVLSVKGQLVRLFLIRDILKVTDAFLQGGALPCVDLTQETVKSNLETGDLLSRMFLGLQSFHRAVKMSPDLWAALLIRMLMKPEFHSFLFDVLSAVEGHSRDRLLEAFWVFVSRVVR